MTEKSFMLAFRRFISRKSIPRVMISDNATTFVAAAEEIRKLTDSKSLHDKLCQFGTTWKFIPKRAPWYGGFWERLVGLTKNCLKKILGRACIDLPLLQTLVVEIEAYLNNRPLTYISSDIADPEPLTPSHLLYGRQIKSFPYPLYTDETDSYSADLTTNHETMNDQAKRRFRLIEQFLARWKHEYLTSLREFHRVSGNNNQSVKQGDVVQIYDDNSPRTTWKLGVIEELTYGNDNLVRSATVRTSNSKLNRPIVKLYPLEICESDSITTQTQRYQRRAKTDAVEKIRECLK
ncbi:uncharacterized protein LOC134722442 [Mytilus trossulus]|uniref:uncharacterized protein LOC134722442 n=1 Tax=Mytilus trossulus TaxID=6551 RepID=UPI003004A536